MNLDLATAATALPLQPDVCLSSPDCVKILDGDGLIQSFNEDGMRLMEIEKFSDVERLYWPLLWPDESKTAAKDALVGARATGLATFTGMCPTALGTPKWWHVTVAAMPQPAGYYVVVSRDLTKERQRQSVEDADRDRFNAIMRANSDVLWDIDLVNGEVWWGEGMTSAFGYGRDQIGDSMKWCHDHIHPGDRERVVASMNEAVIDGSATWEGDFRYLTARGDYVEVHDRGAIIREHDGTPLRFVGVMQDVTARNCIVAVHKLVAGEMSHRVGNILAVVSGIFQQTLRHCADKNALSEAFGGRLKAMATANTAILRGEGAGASLRDIARTQLAPFIGSGQLAIEGDHVALPDHAAQSLALAINELATNALKYGALSTRNGTVKCRWAVSIGVDPRSLLIEWTERGGPSVTIPARTGMGSTLIDRGIRNAKVERRFEPEGFTCSINMPL